MKKTKPVKRKRILISKGKKTHSLFMPTEKEIDASISKTVQCIEPPSWKELRDNANKMRKFVKELQEDDPVDHPPHYTAGSVECIDAIESALTPEEFRGYCKGNVLKYTWRSGLKSKSPIEDLKKAGFYINRVISHLEKQSKL